MKQRKPYKIHKAWTNVLNKLVEEMSISNIANYTLYVTDTVRGRCYYDPAKRFITVPVWAMKGNPKGEIDFDYRIYYVCHELAHSVAGRAANHGADFMEAFMIICPPHLQHYELNYKPRLAAAAGIRRQ